jgi:phage gp16-like protein
MIAAAKKASPIRSGLIGKIHVAKAQLGLDDDTYRAMLKRVTGKESSASCSISQLEGVKAELVNLGWKPAKRAHPRAGKRPLADGEIAGKLRALWISGYHLGVVKDPSEAALAAFVKRATGGKKRGVDALQWLTADDARKAIEALKAWLAREGEVDWGREDPRRAIVEAQHRILVKSNDRYHPDIGVFLHRANRPQVLSLYDAASLDRLIEYLGYMIRVA